MIFVFLIALRTARYLIVLVLFINVRVFIVIISNNIFDGTDVIIIQATIR
jgi:hypothetical protein